MENIINYKCPNCDGALEFDAKENKLKCPYCEGVFDDDTFFEGKEYESTDEIWNDETINVYRCNSCGGEIIKYETTAATSCPYCGSNLVIESNVSGQFKPDRIIPFKVSKNQAKEMYYNHLKGKVLLPNSFKTENIIDEIKGIYVPFYVYSGKGNARMVFNGTRTRSWSDAHYNYTETKYYRVFRAGNVSFKNVPVDVSSKIDNELSESIEPFDFSDFKDFNSNYLAGYLADKYDVNPDLAKNIADERIANSTKALITSTASSFSSLVPISSSVSIREGKREYVMLPMWILNTTYKNKKYQFAMNGQTGKFVGNLPMDKGKLFVILMAVFMIVFIASFVLQFFVMGV